MSAHRFQSLIGRLKTGLPNYEEYRALMFQSLIGRLKTFASLILHLQLSRFQSLIGRLKTFEQKRGHAGEHGFNPS